MAARKTFNIQTCEDCVVYDKLCSEDGHCRLNPPVMINAYTSTYPIVRRRNPACFAGIAGSKAAPPKGYKKK